jgi:hypothetical protein
MSRAPDRVIPAQELLPSERQARAELPEEMRVRFVRAMRRITPTQRRFLRAVLAIGSPWKTAKRMGMGQATIHRWMQQPRFHDAMTLSEQMSDALVPISRAWIRRKLVEIVEKSMVDVPVLDREGNHIGTYEFDGRVAVSALTLLGKDKGMFADKVEVTRKVSIEELILASIQNRGQ